VRTLERSSKALRHPANPERQGYQDTGGRAAQECAKQLDRPRVGPVEIVEHEQERRRPGEMLEE
jgi:hypothetical protein